MMEKDVLLLEANADHSTFDDRTTDQPDGTAASANTSSLVDANSPTYWSYNVMGRRLLFRPVYGSVYKDKADYYRLNYDPVAGFRVAVVLGGLMVFIILIALNNRYGFFRRKRKLNVSVGNSQEELAGVEWLRLMGAQRRDSQEYNPVCSDLDLVQIGLPRPVGFHAIRQARSGLPDGRLSQLDVNSRLAISVEEISAVVPLYKCENKYFKSNSF